VLSLDNFPYDRALELWKASEPDRGAISVERSRLACEVHARAFKFKSTQVMAIVEL
jgi:hypothetical protein